MTTIYVNARYLTQAMTGVQRYAHELVMMLDRLLAEDRALAANYEVVLLAPRRGVVEPEGLRQVELRPVGRFSGHRWEQFDLPREARDGVLFCPGNTAPLASLLRGRKTVVTVHDLGFLRFPSTYNLAYRAFYRFMTPIILRRASAVIAVSDTERTTICDTYGIAAERVTAIQNGGLPGDVVHDGPDPGPEGPEPSVLYVGAINRKKNVHGIIEAAALLADEQLRFVVAGGGARAFKEFDLPEEIERRAKLTFADRISDDELFELYSRALCLVFPSFYEASPLPPIEAMAWGCPVVAARIPALEERCGDAALYCDPNDPADIARKIRTLAHEPALRETLRGKGFEQARRFTWRECALRTLAVIDAVA